MSHLIFAICVFIHLGMAAIAEDLHSHGNGKLVRRQPHRKQIRELMQDGQVIRSKVRSASNDKAEQVTSDGQVFPVNLIHSDMRTSASTRKRIVRKRTHSQRISDDKIEQVTSDGRVFPVNHIHSDMRTGASTRKRIVRKRTHSQRISSDDKIEQVTSDGRVVPVNRWTFNASLEDVPVNQWTPNASLEDDAATVGVERHRCCLLGSSCNSCPLGFTTDNHACAWKGNMRCRYGWEAKRNPGVCCALGSSCNYCPNGRRHDGSCCHSGCFRCNPAPPQLSKAGECCALGSSCAKCPHGSQPNNHECGGRGNYQCIHNDDCWFRCGPLDSYCIHCETKSNEDRACCRKGFRSIICDFVPDSKKQGSRHTCVNVPYVAGNSWVPKLRHTLVEQKTKTFKLKNPITWSWFSWMKKEANLNISYGPGILTDLELKRLRVMIDSPYVTIGLVGVTFKVAFKGSFGFRGKGATGTIDVGNPAPGGDITVKFKLPTSHGHKDENGNFIIGVESVTDTLDLQVGVKLGRFPRAAFERLIDVVKNCVKKGLIAVANAHLGVLTTRSVKQLDAEKPGNNGKHKGTTNPGECCQAGLMCNTCPFGFEHDRSKCANKGDYRCLEQPRASMVGACCALGSSCYRCPFGYDPDTGCASQGSMRCRRIPTCWGKCGNKAGWCLACEKGYACCRADTRHKDPPECENADILFPNMRHHQCARVKSGEPFLRSLRYYVKDKVLQAASVKIYISKFVVGQVDLRRLRTDITANGVVLTYSNPKVSAHGYYRPTGKIFKIPSTFYAESMQGGHGIAVYDVEVKSDGTLGKTTLRHCDVDVEVILKLNKNFLGGLLDLITALLRKFIKRKVKEKICNWLRHLPNKLPLP